MNSSQPSDNPSSPPWEPIFDVPDNLGRDGKNYVEWIWSLLDDGIDVDPLSSFTLLFTQDGQRLLDSWAAEYLDEQLSLARRAALSRGHDLVDVVRCCSAANSYPADLTDELIALAARDPASAVIRAKSIGEICDMAEDFCKAALHFKLDLSVDDRLPGPVRKALNGVQDVP